MPILYFAYGSNMSSPYFLARIRGAKSIGRSSVSNKKIVFNKRSKDGSGKANIVDDPVGIVWGVLYEIESNDLKILDKFEGGYKRICIRVKKSNGNIVDAVTYSSFDLTDQPIPYDWYKEVIISGAVEHKLPKEYIDKLKQFPSKPDKI